MRSRTVRSDRNMRRPNVLIGCIFLISHNPGERFTAPLLFVLANKQGRTPFPGHKEENSILARFDLCTLPKDYRLKNILTRKTKYT